MALSEKGDSNEKPVHSVEITKDFYMGVYQVTVGQYKKYVDEKGGHFEEWCNEQGDNAAVTGVSWEDAQGFISWLNEKEGGEHYRLPTEAEWEYAARAGTTTEYSFGDDASLLGDYAWYDENAYDVGEYYAHIVGQKKPNPWGLYGSGCRIYIVVTTIVTVYIVIRLAPLQARTVCIAAGAAPPRPAVRRIAASTRRASATTTSVFACCLSTP
jgi:formylglycine-generating enzyme required for sulfatase activity